MIYVFVGSSGSGKSKIGKEYFGKEKEVVSFTTREKRLGEIDNVDYIFLTKKEALEMLQEESKNIVEYSIYDNNYYGTLKSELDSKKKNNCFMVLDFEGYKNIKKLFPNDVIGIFIEVSKDVLHNRLVNRGESKSFIENRLSLYDYEQLNKNKLDFILSNENSISDTLKSLDSIVKSD